MVALDSPYDQKIQQDLLSGNPFRIVRAAELAVALDDDPGDIVVHICDKFWRRKGEMGDRLQLTATKPRNQKPTVEVVLPQDSPWKKDVRKCRTEVVGIEVEVGNLRWAAIVDTASYKMVKDGKGGAQRTMTAKCFGIFEILEFMLIWPNFLLPIQVQIPSHAWFLGPVCSVIEIMISEQAFRIQSGLWELVNNAASLNPDLRAWFGTWLISNGDIFDMLTTPVYVVHHNPLFDGSPTVSGTFRMETVKEGIDEMCKGYGVTVDVELWRPGDPPPDEWFPHPDRTSPCYVVRVNDRSSLTGPTDTFLDGIIKQTVNLEGSVFEDMLDPILNPTGEFHPEGVYIAPLLGLHFIEPWPVLIDHEKGPMESFEINDHHPMGWQLVIGGKSPKWACAPRLNRWGAQAQGRLNQRPDQRNTLLVTRQLDDHHRVYGCAKQSARRLAQRRIPGLPTHRELHAQNEHGAVRDPHREVQRYRSSTVQHRRTVRVHRDAVRHQGLPLGAGQLP